MLEIYFHDGSNFPSADETPRCKFGSLPFFHFPFHLSFFQQKDVLFSIYDLVLLEIDDFDCILGVERSEWAEEKLAEKILFFLSVLSHDIISQFLQ